MAPKRKKLIFIICFGLIVAAAGTFWLVSFKRQADLKKRLSEVEQDISSTEEQINKLSALSSEEIVKREKDLDALSARKVEDDVAVPGVKIVKNSQNKLVRNVAEGYSVELPLNLLLARSIASDHLEFHDKEIMCEGDPLCAPTVLIEGTEKNTNVLPLEKWFAKEEAAAGVKIYSPREKLNFSGWEVYKIKESVPGRFDGFYYYWARGPKVYYIRVSGVDEPALRQYLVTLKPL